MSEISHDLIFAVVVSQEGSQTRHHTLLRENRQLLHSFLLAEILDFGVELMHSGLFFIFIVFVGGKPLDY